jgi:hypothetical protein
MNMEQNPTVEELRDLIRVCDDLAGHHVLWVARNGDVQVSRVPRDMAPEGFQESLPEMRLRIETFEAGNEYVGPEAAADDEWVNQLFAALTRDWPRAKVKPLVEYIDQF